MAITKYSYTSATDIVSGLFDEERMRADILATAIKTAIHDIGEESGIFDIWFKAALDAGDKTLFDGDTTGPCGGVVGTHTGAPIAATDTVKLDSKHTADNRIRAAIEKSEGTRKIDVSHNWCDPTTWYQKATRVVDEALTVLTELSAPPGGESDGDIWHVGASATGDWAGQEGKFALYCVSVYDATFTWWEFFAVPAGWTWAANKCYRTVNRSVIDTYHGKLTEEDFLTDGANSFRAALTVNALDQVEYDPHVMDHLNGADPNGDFRLDYMLGLVCLDTATTDAVLLTYHHATTADYCLAPDAGSDVRVDLVELQFTDDMEMKDTVIFQLRGKVSEFAAIGALLKLALPDPTGWPIANYAAAFKVDEWSGNNPIQAGDVIPISQKTYKTMKDFEDESIKSYVSYPAYGGSGHRGKTKATLFLHWEYTREIVIRASLGMEIFCFLRHNEKQGGTSATATFYGVTEASPA